jgi:1,4-dihydroxy-2-naphthoate octaprenyltransferase
MVAAGTGGGSPPDGAVTATVRGAAPMTRREVWITLLLYPGHTLPTAAAPVLVAAGAAAHDGVFAAAPVLLGFLASWLIHLAGVFTDNLVLITKHADVPEHPELLEALHSGALSARGLTIAIVACLAGAAALAPLLAPLIGWRLVIVLGVVGVAASLGYSAGPLPYTRLGIADIVFFAMFAVVAVGGTYAAQAASATGVAPATVRASFDLVPRSVLVAGVGVGALVTNVLLIDEIRDVAWDRRKGWRSSAVRLGRRWARVELWAFSAVAYAVPLFLWGAIRSRVWVLLPLLTAPQAYRVALGVSRSDGFADLFPMTPRASRLALAYSALLAIGLALD